MTDRKTHLTNPATWIRLGFMLVFALLLMAGRLVISIIVVVQFALVLVTGSDNENLRNLGQGLGKWIYQAFMFLTFNSEEKPFPFDEWPTIDPSEGYSVKSAEILKRVNLSMPKSLMMCTRLRPAKTLNRRQKTRIIKIASSG